MAWGSEASDELVFGTGYRVELYSHPCIYGPASVSSVSSTVDQLHMPRPTLPELLSKSTVDLVLDSHPLDEAIVR